MNTKPEEFKIKVVEKDGKRHIQVQARCETIKHADGSQDVIVHAPSLSLLAKHLNLGGK